jgi:hypothetical protein
MRHTCDTHATHMRHTCDTHATHMRHTCDIPRFFSQKTATHMRHTCDTHATHMRHTCDTHATHTFNLDRAPPYPLNTMSSLRSKLDRRHFPKYLDRGLTLGDWANLCAKRGCRPENHWLSLHFFQYLGLCMPLVKNHLSHCRFAV